MKKRKHTPEEYEIFEDFKNGMTEEELSVKYNCKRPRDIFDILCEFIFEERNEELYKRLFKYDENSFNSEVDLYEFLHPSKDYSNPYDKFVDKMKFLCSLSAKYGINPSYAIDSIKVLSDSAKTNTDPSEGFNSLKQKLATEKENKREEIKKELKNMHNLLKQLDIDENKIEKALKLKEQELKEKLGVD